MLWLEDSDMTFNLGELADDPDERCTFECHRDEIPTGSRIETMGESETELSFDEEGNWRCAHRKYGDHDRCVFHLPDGELPADVDVSEAVRRVADGVDGDASRDVRQRRKQLVGANLGRLDLSDEHITGRDNFALDLRCAEIDQFDCSNARFDIPIDLRGSAVDEVRGANSEWSSLHAQHATFETLAFDRATFDAAYFEYIEAERARFYFGELSYVNYHHAEIDWLNCMYADFGEAGFFYMESDMCTFFGASFEGAYLNGVDVEIFNFEGVTADGGIHFDESVMTGAAFDGTTAESATFSNCEFDRVRFVGCQFETGNYTDTDLGIATLEDMECEKLSLSGATIDGSLSLEGTIVRKDLDLTPAAVTENAGYVSLRRSKLDSGEIAQPDEGAIIYDFEKATLGTLTTTGDGEDLLDHLRIVNTDFDGFDFRIQDDIDLENADYTIHELCPGGAERVAVGRAMQSATVVAFPVIDDPENHALDARTLENEVDFEAVDLPEEDAIGTVKERARAESEVGTVDAELDTSRAEQPDTTLLETTYLEAKNGATAVGHTTAAGRFFERERKYRRHAHWERFRGRRGTLGLFDRVRVGTRWFRSELLSLTTGYGERPWRAIGSSFGAILIFTGLYSVLQPPLGTVQQPGPVNYAVFSIQSFVTLIVGSPPETPALWLRAASALEGFLGAFFIALFVFTLTRTVHR
jgi:uncharacterized protein YjbI with pentapeptide repeats